jgi:hypothetical protein
MQPPTPPSMKMPKWLKKTDNDAEVSPLRCRRTALPHRSPARRNLPPQRWRATSHCRHGSTAGAGVPAAVGADLCRHRDVSLPGGWHLNKARVPVLHASTDGQALEDEMPAADNSTAVHAPPAEVHAAGDPCVGAARARRAQTPPPFIDLVSGEEGDGSAGN